MSTCNQSAPLFMVTTHSCPRAPKSADKIEGAMMAGGPILNKSQATLELSRKEDVVNNGKLKGNGGGFNLRRPAEIQPMIENPWWTTSMHSLGFAAFLALQSSIYWTRFIQANFGLKAFYASSLEILHLTATICGASQLTSSLNDFPSPEPPSNHHCTSSFQLINCSFLTCSHRDFKTCIILMHLQDFNRPAWLRRAGWLPAHQSERVDAGRLGMGA